MPETNGNAVVEPEVTEQLTPKEEQPGESADQTDLTEVVRGLSRANTALKKQLAQKAAAPDDDTAAKLAELEKRATAAEAKAAKAELLAKYGDVAPIIKKLMSNDKFDPSLIDDDFVNEIRAAKGKPQQEEEVSVAHNPQRGRANSQDQQDEENLKSIKSIFDLSL